MIRIRPELRGLLVALTVMGCSTPSGSSGGGTHAERGSSSTGKPLVLAAPDLDGKLVDIGADSGKVRVVDFWATWCEPCKDAMPALDAMARELGPRGLTVYGISIDEDRAQIVDFLQKLPVSFPVLWDKGAVQVSRFDVTYMPVTLLVDRKGIIRHVHQGWDDGRSRRERMEAEALLSEAP